MVSMVAIASDQPRPHGKNVPPMRETEMGVSESLETGYWKVYVL